VVNVAFGPPAVDGGEAAAELAGQVLQRLPDDPPGVPMAELARSDLDQYGFALMRSWLRMTLDKARVLGALAAARACLGQFRADAAENAAEHFAAADRAARAMPEPDDLFWTGIVAGARRDWPAAVASYRRYQRQGGHTAGGIAGVLAASLASAGEAGAQMLAAQEHNNDKNEVCHPTSAA
jgi:hypothetical protein